MPMVAATVYASVIATGAGVLVADIAYLATQFLISSLVSQVIGAIFKPKAKDGESAALAVDQSRTVTSKDAAASRRLVYGQTRTGGVIVAIQSCAPRDNASSVEQFQIPTDAPFSVTVVNTVTSVTAVWIRTYEIEEGGFGVSTDTYLTDSGGGPPSSGQYQRVGNTFTFNADVYTQSVFIDYASAGAIIGKANSILYVVIVFAGHECEEIGDVYFDDEVVPLDGSGNVTDGKFRNFAQVYKYLGTPSQAADPMMLLEASDKWTANHTLSGNCYIVCRLRGNVNAYPQGIPNITAVIKGKKDIYDPRTGFTSWLDNDALCRANYIMDAKYGMGAARSEFDMDVLTASANICDEDVDVAAGGTEKRYTCNGIVDTSDTPETIIGKMNTASAGNVVFTSGLWNILVGAYQSPTLDSISEADARGNISVVPYASRKESFNGVKGLYSSPANFYQPADYPPVISDAFAALDGELILQDLDLPFTISPSTAQRVAKITLLQQRQSMMVTYPLRLIGARWKCGDTITVNDAAFGWTDKAFTVIDWTFQIYDDADGNQALGVDLILHETDPSIFDWSTDEEDTIDPAPNARLPNAFLVAAPSMQSPVEELYVTRDGRGVGVKVALSAIAGADGQTSLYQFEYKLLEEDLFHVIPATLAPTIDIFDIAPGTYDFRVKGLNGLGVSSVYSQTRYTVGGLTTAPQDITGFTVIKSAGFALCSWDLSPDLDVKIGGSIVIRHAATLSGATWSDSVELKRFVGDAVTGLVPLVTGTYMAKAVDNTGNFSGTEASFLATEGLVSGFTIVANVTEDDTFDGAKTDVEVVASKLQLTSMSVTGEYLFDSVMDLTTSATRRFEADLVVEAVDSGLLWDDITELWDDITGLWDGGVVNDVNVVLYAATTDDDPGGSPTWTDWAPFHVADFTCRAIKFKLDFFSGSVNHNIRVVELRVDAKEPT